MKRVRIAIALPFALVLLLPHTGPAGPLAPHIASIDPAQVLVGSPELTVVITGAGFRDRRLGAGRLQSRVFVDGQLVESLFVTRQRIDAKIPARFFDEPGELFIQVANGVGRRNTFIPVIGSNAVRLRVAEPERIPVAIEFQTDPEVDVGSCFSFGFYPVDAGGEPVSAEGMSFTVSSDDAATPAAEDGGAQFWTSYCDDGDPITGLVHPDEYSTPYLYARVADPRTIRITARVTEPSIEGTSNAIRIAGGYIAGRVTRQSDGTPAGGVDVYLGVPGGGFGSEPLPFQWRDGSASFAACGVRTGFPYALGVGLIGIYGEPVAVTSHDGTFRTRPLPARGWALYFRPADESFLAAQWSGGTVIPEDALTVEVPDGGTLEGVDATLVAGGRIAGLVGDAATSQPLSDVGVDVVQPASGVRIGHVHTGDDGRFVTAGLPAGSYALRLRPYDRKHLQTWYGGDSLENATLVQVAAGQETSGVSASLAHGAVVTGFVRGVDGTPVIGEVVLYDVGAATPLATGYTDSVGAFRTSPGVPAGEYRVRVRTLDPVHPSGWMNGATSFASAGTITLGTSEEKALDVAMPPGGVFTGRMTSAAGLIPSPVSPGYVEVYDAATSEMVGRGCTDGSGHYQTNGLAKGHYKLRFVPRLNDLAPEWYPDRATFAEAEILTIDYAEVRVADAAVTRGATLAGKITDPQGNPVPNAIVLPIASEPDPQSFFAVQHYDFTDQDGAYEIAGLAPGAYKILADRAYHELPGTWYPGASSRSTAEAVIVNAAERRAAVDFSFGRPSFMEGHVAGLPHRSYAYVEFVDPNDGSALGYAVTDRNGNFRSGPLHAGSYAVRFVAWKRAPAFFGGSFSRAGADLVAVAAGATVPGVDVSLALGRHISGRVTAAHSGRFPAGILVQVFDRSTRDFVTYGVTLEDGSFTTGMLGPGTYAVLYEARDRVFAPQWFSGRQTFEAADVVVVGSDGDVAGTDAVLQLSP